MKKNGFTLIELLCVVAIIAILIIIAVPNVLKQYNESRKKSFITQVRNIAKLSESQFLDNSNEEFDCNKVINGQKMKKCLGKINKDKVEITAIGEGSFKNYIMLDAKSTSDSGVFVDLSDVSLIEVDKDESINIDFIKENKLNSLFKSVSGNDFIDKVKEVYSKNNIEESNQDESIPEGLEYIADMIDKSKDNYIIKNNKFLQKDFLTNSEDQSYDISSSLFIYEIDFTNNMKGVYNIKNFNFDMGLFLKESDLNDFFTSETGIEFEKSAIINDFEFTISEPEKVYIVLFSIYDVEYENFIISKQINSQSLQLIGPSSIDVHISDVKNYVDQGIKNKGNKITDKKNFYSYTDLKEKEGKYTYYYVLKTNEDVKILKRNINVNNYTSTNCFEFELNSLGTAYSITNYYERENDSITGKKCPREIYIPDKYNQKYVESIEDRAFSNKGINSVKFPQRLKSIGWNSFFNNNLKELILPSSLEHIGWIAFTDNNIGYIEYYGKSRFCSQSIGNQKNNTGFGKHSIGKTSGDFIMVCAE